MVNFIRTGKINVRSSNDMGSAPDFRGVKIRLSPSGKARSGSGHARAETPARKRRADKRRADKRRADKRCFSELRSAAPPQPIQCTADFGAGRSMILSIT